MDESVMKLSGYRLDIDTLRYRVHTQVTLPQDEIRISVVVTADCPASHAEREAAE